LPRREHGFEMLCRDARLALRVGEWADASAAAMRALGLGRAATLLGVPAEAVHVEFVAALSGCAIRRSRSASMPGSGWVSTGGVPRACGRGTCAGLSRVEWMLPSGHGSADSGLGMNRAPDRLYPGVVAVLCSCRL
jgi:hypothetical protein